MKHDDDDFTRVAKKGTAPSSRTASTTVVIRPVFDARTLRAVVLLCCGLVVQKLPRKIDRASYRRALDDVMDRCLAHIPYAKGATREERQQRKVKAASPSPSTGEK